MERSKVLVIGLDGATFNVLVPLMNKGLMPNLMSLKKNGGIGNLRSTILPGTPIAWSSMITGKNPGNHGIYEFVSRRPNAYDLSPLDASHRDGFDLWEIIGRKGRKVGVVNVPFTFPPREVNGFMITGLFTPHAGHNFVYPHNLLEELREVIGEYKLFPKETYYPGGEGAFLKDLYDITENRFKATIYLLENKPWDFFVVVFNGPDRIQHSFWKHIDNTHPKWDHQRSPRMTKLFNQYFTRLDQIIGEIINRAGKRTTVFIVSDHGMRELHRFVHINNYLIRLGLLKLKKDLKTRLKLALFRAGFTPELLYRILLKLRIGRVRQRMDRETARNLLRPLFLSFDDVNWSETKAYQLVGGHIFLNLKGREPEGIVEPGKDATRLLKRIVNWLNKLRDPISGEKIISHVYEGKKIYAGSRVNSAPDIIFLPASPYDRFTEYEFASNKLLGEPYGISGSHHMDGIFFIKGSGIKPNTIISNVEMPDISPTILYCMGLPIPTDMDGKVVSDAFDKTFLSSNPPSYSKPYERKRREKYRISKEDEEKVKERLRQLGYLG